MELFIEGKQLTSVYTMGSMYDNDSIIFRDSDNNRFNMKVSEILKFHTDFNSIIFKVVKKRVHYYLEVSQ